MIDLPDAVASTLADMEAEATRVAASTEDKWLRARSLQPDAAQFLMLLAQAMEAKRILEIGTSVGYSTVHLAMAAKNINGHVTTLELLPAKHAAARDNLARAGLSAQVTQRLGDALKLLPALSGPWDLVFLDAEKEIYAPAFTAFKDFVRVGGLVAADNAISHADGLGDYFAAVRNDGRFDTVTVPIGRGIELSYRRV